MARTAPSPTDGGELRPKALAEQAYQALFETADEAICVLRLIFDEAGRAFLLAPLPDQRPLDRLRATGDLVPARAALADLPEPMALGPGLEPPSSVLDRLRRDER